MKTLRVAGIVGLVIAAVAAWTPTHPRKELVRLQLSAASGAVVGVRVATRGLIVLAPNPSKGRQPAQLTTTISTPTELTLGGIGEADIDIVDSVTTLVADVTQVRQNAPPAQRLTGRSFRVSRATYSEPYRVTDATTSR